eukprot:6189840-Pleurochrysis_carterae.AAC.1
MRRHEQGRSVLTRAARATCLCDVGAQLQPRNEVLGCAARADTADAVRRHGGCGAPVRKRRSQQPRRPRPVSLPSTVHDPSGPGCSANGRGSAEHTLAWRQCANETEPSSSPGVSARAMRERGPIRARGAMRERKTCTLRDRRRRSRRACLAAVRLLLLEQRPSHAAVSIALPSELRRG